MITTPSIKISFLNQFVTAVCPIFDYHNIVGGKGVFR